MPEFESFVKACQTYFSEGEHGRKVEIPEFKTLTTQDKYDLSDMLNEIGYTHPRYAPITK
jgi:hypothetical protein